MKFLAASLALLFLAGCLSSPISSSGGIGAVTVKNTSPDRVISAAQTVFAGRGYTLSDSNYPESISFDKPAGGFGNAMWGSYGAPQSIRVKIQMVAIPMLLYGQAIGSLDILWLGQHLLEIAAILTIWSMLYYLQKAWPTIKDSVGS
jgi:hypothetical protein